MQGASRSSLAALRGVLAEQSRGADAAAVGQLSESLFAVVSLLGSQGSLRRTLSVANVSAALIERAVLAPRGRTLERVFDDYSELAAKRRERLVAHVTSAEDLTADQQAKLAEALKREFGHEVRLQVVVDPDLIGGITVRVGDELIDGSVVRHLDAAKRQLTGGR